MSAKKRTNRNALDYTKFADTPAYELAVVVHRETEAQRAIEALAFKAQHGDIPPPTNALLALTVTGPHDGSAYKPWSEYAKSFDVLERCREELGGSLGDVAKRIALELRPENSEAMFWMATWLQALDHADDLKSQMAEQTQAIDQARQKRTQDAIDAAKAKHKDHADAKDYVLTQWQLFKDSYKGNRTRFAKHYVAEIKAELGIEVAQRTISADWLKGI